MDKEKLTLLLTGLAAGDSLGSTSEFVPREDVPGVYAEYRDRGWPFKQVGGGTLNWRPGAPTDDTRMALCIVRSFLRRKCFDGADVAQEFVRWLDGHPPDVGNATRRGLGAVRAGTPWHDGGLADYRNNPNAAANGSLMRNGVVPALADSLDDAFRMSALQSLPTHYAPLPVLCCCAQTYLLWEVLATRSMPMNWLAQLHQRFARWFEGDRNDAVLRWRGNVEHDVSSAWAKLENADFDPDSFNPFTIEFGGADGYCLLTLQIAMWAAHWSSRGVPFPTPARFPDDVFRRAIGPWFLAAVAMIGHDSDTYGAAAGPLIAALHNGLPDDLTSNLKAAYELVAM